MTTPSDDLRFAEQRGLCVNVTLLNGQHYDAAGVHDVDDEQGYASLYTPQYNEDETTRTRIRLDDIESVTVLTDLPWTTG
jgi:hypothetical protein